VSNNRSAGGRPTERAADERPRPGACRLPSLRRSKLWLAPGTGTKRGRHALRILVRDTSGIAAVEAFMVSDRVPTHLPPLARS